MTLPLAFVAALVAGMAVSGTLDHAWDLLHVRRHAAALRRRHGL